jgi:hypothetical protein
VYEVDAGKLQEADESCKLVKTETSEKQRGAGQVMYSEETRGEMRSRGKREKETETIRVVSGPNL